MLLQSPLEANFQSLHDAPVFCHFLYRTGDTSKQLTEKTLIDSIVPQQRRNQQTQRQHVLQHRVDVAAVPFAPYSPFKEHIPFITDPGVAELQKVLLHVKSRGGRKYLHFAS